MSAPDIDAINEGDVDERDRVLKEAQQRASTAEAKAASRSFPRLRFNVTNRSPGYIHCSVFQSNNGGTNWACSGTDLTFDEDWFAQTFGIAVIGDRFEFELVGIHRVTG